MVDPFTNWMIYIQMHISTFKKKSSVRYALVKKLESVAFSVLTRFEKSIIVSVLMRMGLKVKRYIFSKYGQILQTHITSYSYRGQKGEGGLLLEAFVFA